jgi:hypothetical protein
MPLSQKTTGFINGSITGVLLGITGTLGIQGGLEHLNKQAVKEAKNLGESVTCMFDYKTPPSLSIQGKPHQTPFATVQENSLLLDKEIKNMRAISGLPYSQVGSGYTTQKACEILATPIIPNYSTDTHHIFTNR